MSRTRLNWLALFIWVCCFSWGIAQGGKLFELQVVIAAWAANPPDSLALLPYGPKYPNDPGDFYQPLSAFLVLGLLGGFVLGWRGPWTFKRWLWLMLAALVIIWAATPTLFWPMIRELYWASTGKQPLSAAAAQAVVDKWLLYDWVRTAVSAFGFVCALKALRTLPLGTEA